CHPGRASPRGAAPRDARSSADPVDAWRATADPAAGGAAGWCGWGAGWSRLLGTWLPGLSGSRRREQPPPREGRRQRGSRFPRRSEAAPRRRPERRRHHRGRADPAGVWCARAGPAAPRGGHHARTRCGFPSLLLVVWFSTADVIKDAFVLVENPSTKWVKTQPEGARSAGTSTAPDRAHPRLGRPFRPGATQKPPPRRSRRGLLVGGASKRRFVELGTSCTGWR